MARRKFTVIFTVLGFAFVVSVAGFVLLYLLVGREPAVPVERDARAEGRRRSFRSRAEQRRGLPAGRQHTDRSVPTSRACGRQKWTRACRPCC